MDGTDMIPDLRYRFFDENNDVLRYNIFHAELVIRHSENRAAFRRESPAGRTPCSRAVVVRQAHGPVNSGQDGVTIDKEG